MSEVSQVSEGRDLPLRLYELVVESGRSASPFVWRIRYALAHKGLPFESIRMGFTDIPRVASGRFKTVPVLEHGTDLVCDSWAIAEYLDRAFSGTPRLFSSPAELAMVQLFDAWFMQEVLRRMVGVYLLDVHDAAHEKDRSYFRQSREARFGVPLEALVAEREKNLAALRDALNPVRAQLARHPFLGGATPNYADYIALGAFQWVASINTLPPLLKADQDLASWIDRGFDLFKGCGREPGLRPLFA